MNNKTITINSFNCCGIRKPTKRNTIFNWLKTLHNGVCFLQETHSVETDEVKWEKEWGGNFVYCHGEYNARGAAILIPSSISDHFTHINGHKDNFDRVIIINCKIEECTFTLMNL